MMIPVSIPRSGFCSFKRSYYHQEWAPWELFQSLGRDSVHSSCHAPCFSILQKWGFNPSVGILFIQATRMVWRAHQRAISFNPSVGILFIQANVLRFSHCQSSMFQSLGRDSVHSSPVKGLPVCCYCGFQSLGRDSVHSS